MYGQSKEICGNLRKSKEVQWNPMKPIESNGNQRNSKEIIWNLIEMEGKPALAVQTISFDFPLAFLSFPLDFIRFPWVSLDFYTFLKISLELFGFPLISFDFPSIFVSFPPPPTRRGAARRLPLGGNGWLHRFPNGFNPHRKGWH